MSRSFHKVANSGLNHSKFFKQLVHRRNRHIEDIPNGSAYKFSVNQWDICDYKCIYTTYNDFKYFLRWSSVDKLYKIWRK